VLSVYLVQVHRFLSDGTRLLQDAVTNGVGKEVSGAAEADTYFAGLAELWTLSRRIAEVARFVNRHSQKNACALKFSFCATLAWSCTF
jgi:hypothetical protein